MAHTICLTSSRLKYMRRILPLTRSAYLGSMPPYQILWEVSIQKTFPYLFTLLLATHNFSHNWTHQKQVGGPHFRFLSPLISILNKQINCSFFSLRSQAPKAHLQVWLGLNGLFKARMFAASKRIVLVPFLRTIVRKVSKCTHCGCL